MMTFCFKKWEFSFCTSLSPLNVVILRDSVLTLLWLHMIDSKGHQQYVIFAYKSAFVFLELESVFFDGQVHTAVFKWISIKTYHGS